MKKLAVLGCAAAICCMSTDAFAQRRGGGEGQDQQGRRPPANPIIAALDANNDGEISSEELENAVKALKKLDRNEDGKLTADELGVRRGGRGGRGGDGGGQGGGQGGAGGRGQFDPSQAIARIMESDEDGDGKLSKEELPERMQRMFDRADSNEDGYITKAELESMFQNFSRGGRGGRGGDGAGGRGGRGGKGGRPPRDGGKGGDGGDGGDGGGRDDG